MLQVEGRDREKGDRESRKERDREEELMLMVGFAGSVFLYYLKKERQTEKKS